jgi:hypothetical protein
MLLPVKNIWNFTALHSVLIYSVDISIVCTKKMLSAL